MKEEQKRRGQPEYYAQVFPSDARQSGGKE